MPGDGFAFTTRVEPISPPWTAGPRSIRCLERDFRRELVEAPGTAPGSATLIPQAIYRHSRLPDAEDIGWRRGEGNRGSVHAAPARLYSRHSRNSGNPFPHKKTQLGSRVSRYARDDAAVSDRGPACRAALGHPCHFVFCAPTCWSQMRNASTCAAGGNDCVWGNSVSHLSYSGRPNSLMASWLSFGAIDSDTFLTAGPG